MEPDVIALFHTLADRSEAERGAFYDKHHTPQALREEVESLVRFDRTAASSLSGLVAHGAESVVHEREAFAGDRFGSYRLIRMVGSGGMGAVYEAEQDNPRRIVALKVIRAGLATSELVRRFLLESEALGRLQHPGIASIYEAGSADTPMGPRPFFAMEFVAGAPLLEYADARQLDTRLRLELMARVCDAVEHAHQRGIIHRHLKPGNILVDEAGQPKILDFGVAKLTGGDMQFTHQTGVGQLIGTLAYMSPEQVRADPFEIDTRSDEYALGVILYELLAHRPPYDTSGTLPQVARGIVEDEALPLGAVDRRLRGDVETLVAKALEKDKGRRYGSVAMLAEDIRRHLRGDPIVAHPPSLTYQLRKFAGRQRALVAGVAGVFLVLTIGVAVSTWQAARARRAEAAAEREADTARALNDFLQRDLLAQASAYTQASTTTAPDPDLKVRTALDRAAANIASRFAGRPEVEAAVRHTIGESYKGLGLEAEAQAQLEGAVDLRRRALGAEHPDTLRSLSLLATLYVARGAWAKAEPAAIQVVEGQRRTLGLEHPQTLTSLWVLADVYRYEMKLDEAVAILTSLVPASKRVKGSEHSDTLDAEHLFAVVHRHRGEYAEAEAGLRSVLEARRRLQGDSHPDTMTTVNDLGVLLESRGRYAEALALTVPLVEEESRVMGALHPNTISSIGQLAVLSVREGRFQEAESYAVRAVDAARRVFGDDSAMTLAQLQAIGIIYIEAGKLADAASTLREVLAGRQRILGADNVLTVQTLSAQALLLRARGDYATAESQLARVQTARRQLLPKGHPLILTGAHDLGALLLDREEPIRAEAAFAEALAGRRMQLGATHPDTLASLLGLADSQARQGNDARAEATAREALDAFEKARPGNWRRHYAECVLGAVAAGQGRLDEADRLLAAGDKGLTEQQGTIPFMERADLQRCGSWHRTLTAKTSRRIRSSE